MQGGVSKHILTCLDLRRVTYYGVEDVRRALILTSLSKKSLTQEEQNIYQNSLNENIAFYSAYSKSSLFNAEYIPLVYLTIQHSKDNQHYLMYEFRKNGAEIKRYGKKILVSQPYIKFSDINAVSNQNYLSYIQQEYPVIQLYKTKRKAKTIEKQVNTYQKSLKTYLGEEYIVINSFEVLYKGANPDNTIVIHPNHILIKLREDKNNVYFMTKSHDRYFASKTWWEKATKKVGGIQ
jgi:hypothetical protein